MVRGGIEVTMACALGACSTSPAGTIVVTGTMPAQLVMDSRYVYWSDALAAGIYKAPLDAMSATPTLVAADAPGNSPGPLTIDATSAYWIDQGFSGPTSSLLKVPLDGETPVTLATGLEAPSGLAVDPSRVYWTDNKALEAVPLAGGTVQFLTVDDQFIRGLVVRDAHAYWSTTTSLRSLDLADPSASPVTIATSYVMAFAADAANIYWLTGDPNGQGVQPLMVVKAPLTGGPTTTLYTWNADTSTFYPYIAVGSTGVYWTEDARTLTRVGLDGNGADTLVSSLGIQGLAVGMTDVYWGDTWKDGAMVINGIRKIAK